MIQQLLFPLEHNDELSIVTHSGTQPWPELTALIRKHALRRPLFLGDPADGLDPLFHLACLDVPVPPSEGNPYKIPLVRTIAHSIGHDVLISLPFLVIRVIDEFIKTGTSIPFRIIGIYPDSAFSDTPAPLTLDPSLDIPICTLPHPLEPYRSNSL